MNSLLAGCAALSIGITTAFGQAAAPPKPTNPALRPAPASPFASMDANRDGRVSRDEAQGNGALIAAWSTVDANGDTYLSAAEFGKWKAPASGGPMGKMPAGSSPETAADPQDWSVPQNATDSQPATKPPNAEANRQGAPPP